MKATQLIAELQARVDADGDFEVLTESYYEIAAVTGLGPTELSARWVNESTVAAEVGTAVTLMPKHYP